MPFDGQDDKDSDANSPADLDSPVDFKLHCGEIVRCLTVLCRGTANDLVLTS